MSTISENLQIIADSTAAIKQAIIDKGGDVTGGAAVQSGRRWQPQAQHWGNLRQHPGAGKPWSSQV